MSVQALSWVLDNSVSEHAARLVLISIANHCDKFGMNAWPTVSTIGSEARLCEREVRQSLRELESLGELLTSHGVGPRRSNLYSLPKMQGAINAPAEFAPAEFAARGQNLSKQGAEFVGAIRKNRPEPSLEPSAVRKYVFDWIALVVKHQRRDRVEPTVNALAVGRELTKELGISIPAELVHEAIAAAGVA